MAVLISGKLIGPNGDPRPGVTIMLTAVKTSSAVVHLAPSSSTTGPDGSYSLSVEIGTHNVMIEAYGRPFEKVGQITVYSDSKPGTLNDFLTTPGADELTPAIVAMVDDMRAAAATYAAIASDAATRAEGSAEYVQNVSDANTYYTSPTDPDGTVAGIAGTPDEKMFRVAIKDDSGSIVIFKYYKNAGGTAEYINSEASARLISQMDQAINYMKLVIPQDQSNKISGYQILATDVTGGVGLYGVNDNGGFEVCGISGAIQDYFSNLVSESFSSKVSGYQFVFLTADKKTALFAIDDDGYFWIPGMDEPVQTAIANSGGKGAERLARPDGSGRIALYASEDDTTPLWSKSPVVSAEKVTDTGISLVYNENGVLKSALIPINPLQNASTEIIREINVTSREMHAFLAGGQSLSVGGGGGAVAALPELFGHCLMFSGAGKDRGAGIDGDVTNDSLGALCDARIINFRNNSQVPAAQTVLLKHKARGQDMPVIVTRLDSRGGFNYSQLKKGTQPYIDGTTSFDAFCKRAESIGKIPVCQVYKVSHGEADANKATLQFGEYGGFLTEWKHDKQQDIMARSGQLVKPWFEIDQLGSLTNKTVINGIVQRGYVVAIDQWEFCKNNADAFMSIPKWLLNRLYPQDFLHLTGLGYRVLGEWHGSGEDWTIYNRTSNPTGVKFTPVQPSRIVRINDTTSEVFFDTPYGNALQTKPVKGVWADNFGADLQDGSANIISAVQESDFSFKFVTDVPPAVGDYIRFGCNATDNGINSYPLVNIFDTTDTVSYFDASLVMANPCAISRIAVI